MSREIYGKSVQGANHSRAGIDCQDRFAWEKISDSMYVIALADGHGSRACPFSEYGADIAANVFCDVMRQECRSFENNEDFITYLNREGQFRIARSVQKEWQKQVKQDYQGENREAPPGALYNDNTAADDSAAAVADTDTDADANAVAEADADADAVAAAKADAAIYRLYGTTLLGLLIADDFTFAFQIGDGDILYIDEKGLQPIIEAEKLLGVETHSLSSPVACDSIVTAVRRNPDDQAPHLYWMSTDGFENSYPSRAAFENTCRDYFAMIREHGFKAIRENLEKWLIETTTYGCGDDVSVVMNYNTPEDA